MMKEIFNNWRGFLVNEDIAQDDELGPPKNQFAECPEGMIQGKEGLCIPDSAIALPEESETAEDWEKANPPPEKPLFDDIGYPTQNTETLGPPVNSWTLVNNRAGHYANDIYVGPGEPVIACGDGVVTRVVGFSRNSRFHKTWRTKLVPKIYQIASSLSEKIKTIKPKGKKLTLAEVVGSLDGDDLYLWNCLRGKSLKWKMIRLKRVLKNKYPSWESFRKNMKKNTKGAFNGAYSEFAAKLWRREKYGAIGGSTIYIHHQCDDDGHGGGDPEEEEGGIIPIAYNFGYMHLGSASVKKGDKVKKGQVIGTTGTTGVIYSKPHVHLQAVLAKVVDLESETPEHPRTHGKRSKRLIPWNIIPAISVSNKNYKKEMEKYEKELKKWQERKLEETAPKLEDDPVAPRIVPGDPTK
jgi:murein DD-endopeptidase MepM/ murein hydrolase activator NlpD